MGAAYTAVPDEIESVWYNAAGPADIISPALMLSYSKPFMSLGGVNIANAYVSYLYPVNTIGNFGATWARFDTMDLYREDTIMLSYSRNLDLFSAGVNVKYLARSITIDARTAGDSVFAAGASKSAVTCDAGILKKLGENLAVGLSFRNLNQPDVGFESPDPVPMEVKLGASSVFRPKRLNGDITGVIDITMRNNEFLAGAGAEAWLLKRTLATRMGFNKNDISIGASYVFLPVDTEMRLQTDYSFSWPLSVEGTAGSHRLSFGVKF